MVTYGQSRDVAGDGYRGGRRGDGAVVAREGIDDGHGDREQRDQQDDAHDADADVTATLNVAIVCSNRLRNSDGSSTGAGLQKKEKSRTHFKI